VRHPCPCCGFLTFDHPADGSYDICPVCFWEDDERQNRDPGYAGGANRPSLDEARRNFAALGAIESRLVHYTREPTSDERPLLR
jgi:hypothetical protein